MGKKGVRIEGVAPEAVVGVVVEGSAAEAVTLRTRPDPLDLARRQQSHAAQVAEHGEALLCGIRGRWALAAPSEREWGRRKRTAEVDAQIAAHGLARMRGRPGSRTAELAASQADAEAAARRVAELERFDGPGRRDYLIREAQAADELRQLAVQVREARRAVDGREVRQELLPGDRELSGRLYQAESDVDALLQAHEWIAVVTQLTNLCPPGVREVRVALADAAKALGGLVDCKLARGALRDELVALLDIVKQRVAAIDLAVGKATWAELVSLVQKGLGE